MIELHGWVTIRETYKAKFDEEDNIDVVIENIKKEIKCLLWFKPCIKIQNGVYYLEFTSFSNRKNVETQEIFKLYNRIGELAVGSYGLIYLYEEEEKENQFQVFSLSRGIVQELKDVYLSPIIPIIEDEV